MTLAEVRKSACLDGNTRQIATTPVAVRQSFALRISGRKRHQLHALLLRKFGRTSDSGGIAQDLSRRPVRLGLPTVCVALGPLAHGIFAVAKLSRHRPDTLALRDRQHDRRTLDQSPLHALAAAQTRQLAPLPLRQRRPLALSRFAAPACAALCIQLR